MNIRFPRRAETESRQIKTSIDKQNSIYCESIQNQPQESNESVNQTIELEDELKRQRKINKKSISTIKNLQEQLLKVKTESKLKLREYKEKYENTTNSYEESSETHASKDTKTECRNNLKTSSQEILIKTDESSTVNFNDPSSTKSTKDTTSLIFINKLSLKEKELKEAREEIK